MKRTLYSLPHHCLLQKVYAKLGKCVHCGAFEIKRCRDKALERKIKKTMVWNQIFWYQLIEIFMMLLASSDRNRKTCDL